MSRNRLCLALALASPLAFAGASDAVIVSGHVLDELGLPIQNVDLDFEDDDTGLIIFTPNDNTDATGFYSVDVPLGRYNVFFNSPDPFWLDLDYGRVDVDGAMTIDAVLYQAHLLIGHVQNEAGAPLATVDLNFFDSVTGDQFLANDDNTDVLGNFAVFIPGTTFDVFFTAPLGQPYAGGALYEFAAAGTTNVGTIVLADGLAVTGSARGPGNVALVDVDLDFEDATTNDLIYTPRDNTDALGNFNVLVPEGTYHVTVKSAAGSNLAWKSVYDVPVTGPTSIGTVALSPGVTVTGTVRNGAAQPLPGCDLDLFDRVVGHDLPTANDNTAANGTFSVFPANGATFDLFVKPQPGLPLAGAVIRDVHPTANLNVGVITLPAGHPISGVIRDSQGNPVAAADLDAFELGNGLPFPMVGDDSDALGNYAVRLPAGSWTLGVTPPAGSGLLPTTVTIDPLSGPVVLDITLPGSSTGVPEQLAVVRGFTVAPNPFRVGGGTSVSFDLAREVGSARVLVTDVQGRRVQTIAAGRLAAGRQTLTWDGRDALGRSAAAGVYFLRLDTGLGTESKRVVLLR
ncbi:MAG: T9SS type A sorting domain-containing protein [Gemmatimonadetes bacterium]|nr:T9SS type A sorting domain-containing protein [Gemmatimonadota bacterium]